CHVRISADARETWQSSVGQPVLEPLTERLWRRGGDPEVLVQVERVHLSPVDPRVCAEARDHRLLGRRTGEEDPGGATVLDRRDDRLGCPGGCCRGRVTWCRAHLDGGTVPLRVRQDHAPLSLQSVAGCNLLIRCELVNRRGDPHAAMTAPERSPRRMTVVTSAVDRPTRPAREYLQLTSLTRGPAQREHTLEPYRLRRFSGHRTLQETDGLMS